jgi:hypothetical protein
VLYAYSAVDDRTLRASLSAQRVATLRQFLYFGWLGFFTTCCGRTEDGAPTQSISGSLADQSLHPAGAASLDVTRPSSPLRPLVGYPWLITLGKTGTGEDVATPPLGATEPRPIVVAVHGAGDRPDWACGGWRIGLEAYSFVVCPVGQPMANQRYGWSSARAVNLAIERALEALRSRFKDYCSPAPIVYAGFSQGATLASRFLIENAQRFPTAVLAEGGYNYINDPRFSRTYFENGGRRVLLLCGNHAASGTQGGGYW